MKQTVIIAGLGLIGGSIAKAIQKTGNYHLIGYDNNEDTCIYAKENEIIDEISDDFLQDVQKVITNFIDEISDDFLQDVQKARFVILATPISATIQLMKQLNNVPLNEELIVTDVASVKGTIIKEATNFTNEKITFIGGHPMAGSHKTGIEAAKDYLFENAMFVLIPTNNPLQLRYQSYEIEAAKDYLFENAIFVLIPTTQDAQNKVSLLKDVYGKTNSRFIILQPEEHDEMTSVVSHFPHLIASSLVHQAKKWENMHAFLPELAAGGFRDITRIASSSPEMWQDIFYHNRFKMIQLLDEWIVEMQGLKNVLNYNNKASMVHYLQQAKDYRDGLAPKQKGAIPSFYDVYVDIEDQPGAILSVVQLLASAEISITNIRILEIREGITGALRISFSRKVNQKESFHLLTNNGYDVTIED